MQIVLRTVEGIDDPVSGRILSVTATEHRTANSVVRPGFRQCFDDGRLGPFASASGEFIDATYGRLQLADFVEIAQQHAADPTGRLLHQVEIRVVPQHGFIGCRLRQRPSCRFEPGLVRIATQSGIFNDRYAD